MFAKRNLVDIKKSTSKLQDPKKDVATRIKHLKIILENVDTSDAKGFFEANFSHIYNILYESFVQTETNLRQRVHKAHKEELECTLWILEQVLCLLPELIHRRWQLHSLSRLLAKLLHPGNSIKLRRQGIRYFLIWYQALNENAPEYVHNMFSALVPGFGSQNVFQSQHSGSVFHDTSAQHPVTATELLPILPPSNGEKSPENASKFYLEALLEYMVHTVVKLEWQDKNAHHHRCFSFLLEKFKLYYIPKMFPNFCKDTSLYKPNLDLPILRRPESENEFVQCRVSFILWTINYMHQTRKSQDKEGSVGPPSIQNMQSPSQHSHTSHDDDSQHDSSHPSLDSTISIQTNRTTSDEELGPQIVREVLYSTRDNINFLHELYRQAFLLNFTQVVAIRKIIGLYKDLIQGNVIEIPPYALEMPEDVPRNGNEDISVLERPTRLRNDSYLGAIHKENLLVRAGTQNIYQLFTTHAANVFLIEINSHAPRMLEEQTDACKRVLNIYRYMVMNTRMDSSTWEQLLTVLLQITSLVLGETPPKKKTVTLGGKLAPAIFQTLIVTWIKANLNVMISRELWDRFLQVLTTLTVWEELIKEWAKTMETLTRVLARHVYNLDLTNLPLDRLNDNRSKRSRRTTQRQEQSTPCSTGEPVHPVVSRQDSALPDGQLLSKRTRSTLSRSYSDNDLTLKRRSSQIKQRNLNRRRSKSLEFLAPQDTESTDRTRSPSPAPSSGMESNSIKDSPIQLDMLSADHQTLEFCGEHRGVICGGSIRGWLPDVAVIIWKRMLGALGDINKISDPKLHAQVFEYLVKLTDTLIKLSRNQGISFDNMSTPHPPELIPPLTLILPWCFGALVLPSNYEAGKLNALRLICTITVNCDSKHRTYLPQVYRFLHTALTGSSKLVINTCLKYLGPRFFSLQLPGASLLLLDFIHACNIILNNTEKLESSPRTEAMSFLANLLSHTENLNAISVLQPDSEMHIMTCPDIKEHIVSILLRAGRREPKGKARCIALSALGIFVYKELKNQTFHSKITDAINVLLLALKFNNKIIAQLASNILFLLCDHAPLLWSQYPRLSNAVISTLCSALFLHTPLGSTAGESDKALGTALLFCLGEWCMKLGPQRLLEISEYGETRGTCLLLQVFTVLHKIMLGKASLEHPGGLSQPSINDDFDPNILADDFEISEKISSSKNNQCQDAIKLCARTILSHLVSHLGHFPMAIGATRLSSLVAEHDDVPNLSSDDLSTSIFSASNIQLFILSKNIIASLVELPALELPEGGITAGLSTADKQVRVILRDLSGKSSWDASILYKNPEHIKQRIDLDFQKSQTDNVDSGIQMESLMVSSPLHNLPQRAIRHRPPSVLPDVSNAAPDLDQLDDLLQYLGYTSPECLENFNQKLNEPAAPPMSTDIENEAIASVISQRNLELEDSRFSQQIDSMLGQPVERPNSRSETSYPSFSSVAYQQNIATVTEQNAFQHCRLFFSQLGLAGWERRQQLHLLNKTERLLRELRNLDNQSCRETHKFAIIYVAPGQEDKNSVLSNQGGSIAYEQFLASLAWEVELEGHTGFLGGLQRQGTTGLTAPYIATSFLEAIFHVATRMPGDSPEAVLNKIRHLGNDEVHIVWSEHNRDYRRDIIPTEFCDILITIYPLGGNLNRVTINLKSDVPHFGVLFNEAIVETSVLAGLVRATAICASRAKRITYEFYQQYYEERAKSLETVVTKHKKGTTYEEFISKVYSPVLTPNLLYPNSLSSNNGDVGSNSMLAAALLDSHGHIPKSSQRADQKFRASANEVTRSGWFQNLDNQIVESSISPRPMKRISTNLKPSKKSVKRETSVESPPESPLQITRRK
ncbi:ral GTPase-activating protein subunit alpha-1 isoform X2 [Diabrotica virgifera virgifera]|uniref:Rap-GAP domain-containing protein n=1 Tax=Diabrotica virgifera virgifera TaxID=50390 RepID=A0ABM5K809_DIAVI|nr:ral GTPase-activating protein subunit alpha-1 isoform X2 [Diabrotica virgifera virgifera]